MTNPSTPTIAGTMSNQVVGAKGTSNPFVGVTIGDTNTGAIDTLTIALSGSGGTLADVGNFHGLALAGSVYTLTGNAASITSELDALVFTPAATVSSSSTPTTFTLTDVSSAFGVPTVDSATTVTVDPGPTCGPVVRHGELGTSLST